MVIGSKDMSHYKTLFIISHLATMIGTVLAICIALGLYTSRVTPGRLAFDLLLLGAVVLYNYMVYRELP